MLWSRLYWLLLHASGYVYKLQNRDFTTEEKQAIKTFLGVWCKYLHCGICIGHCEEYLKTRLDAVDQWTHSSEFWAFGVEFHNEVNRTTKKPEITVEVAEQELLNKLLKIYKITDMNNFPWTMEDFTHIVVLFTVAFTSHVKTNPSTAIDNMKTLCTSLAFIMPFQFSSHKEKKLRDIWAERVAQWDWSAIQSDPTSIYDEWRSLFTAMYSAQTDLMDRMLVYLNKETSAVLDQNRQLEEAKAAKTEEVEAKVKEEAKIKEEVKVKCGLEFKYVIMFVISHVVLVLFMLWYVCIQKAIHKVKASPKVSGIKGVM